MAIKMVTPIDAMNQGLNRACEIIKEEIINQLAYLGEECVTRIRQSHPGDWKDQTGNLRSSIGTAIFDYGKRMMESAFEQVGSGNAGSDKGRSYIESLASEYSKVYALVVVAGMEYAEFVEARRDVLEGAKLWAQTQVDSRIKRALNIAEKRINKMMTKL